MKTLLILIGLYSFLGSIYGQYHHNLPTTTAVWHATESTPGGVWTTDTYPYSVFNGDTLINGESFVKCYKSESGGYLEYLGCVKNDYPTPMMVFAPADGSIHDTIFFPQEPVMNDVFTFDPLLQEIFPFLIATPNTDVHYSTMGVDSIQCTDGYHKRYKLHFEPLGIAYYVDGVGMTYYIEAGTSVDSEVDCFSIDNTEILNPGQSGCAINYFNISVEENESSQFNAFYVNGFIFFENVQDISYPINVKIYDMNGKTLFDESLTSTNPLSVANLKYGMHLVTATDGTNSSVFKFIKY
ncbi:T9SS type A sorting domain-containing protein [Parvicella tangerina]|nr:T9SS type A sorting domain-containing protein [Parvicella tangerina]